MRAQRGLRARLAHVLLGRLDATGTSTEHTTCPVRRSSSGRPLRHVGRLANAPQVPSDARRIRDKREQLHPSAAARARQNVETKCSLEKLRPRPIAASARALGHVRRGFWRNRRLRRETGPQLTRRREHTGTRSGQLGHRLLLRDRRIRPSAHSTRDRAPRTHSGWQPQVDLRSSPADGSGQDPDDRGFAHELRLKSAGRGPGPRASTRWSGVCWIGPRATRTQDAPVRRRGWRGPGCRPRRDP